MLRNSKKWEISLLLASVALVLLIAGCSDNEGTDAITDGTYWTEIDVEEIEIPGAIWALAHNQVIVGADNEYVYLSDDGGLGWSNVTLDAASGRNASDMYFAGSRGIMIGLRGMLYTTTDNGNTWVDAFPTGAPAGDLNDIITPATGTDNPLFISGGEGALFRSIDGGEIWEYIEVFIDHFFDSLAVIDTAEDTTWALDTTLFADQEKMNFYGGFAPTPDLIYILGDTLGGDSLFYLFRSTEGGDSGSWDMITFISQSKYYDLHLFDDYNGLMVGDNGEIFDIAIEDSSISIALNELLTSVSLSELEFINSSLGWVIGGGGVVARTTDGGGNWEEIDVDVTGVINDISFLDENEGWLVGDDVSRSSGAIKVTYDGGDTWNFRSYGLGGVDLNGIHFVSATEGWLVGKAGRIAHTTDAGVTWIHQDANLSRSLQDLYFIDEDKGWAVGFAFNGDLDTTATILETTDGGTNWTAVDSLSGYRLNKVAFADVSNGWAVGNNGLILHSSDWHTQQVSGVSVELFGLDVISSSVVFACGQAGTILKTTDGGATWNQLASDSITNQTLMDIDMVTSSIGYACGNLGTVIKTTNGGTSWELLELPSHSGSVFKSVGFIDSETGWTVGFFGYIMHTADGGETWYRQNEGFSEETLNDIYILNSNRAWIVGNGSVVMELGRN